MINLLGRDKATNKEKPVSLLANLQKPSGLKQALAQPMQVKPEPVSQIPELAPLQEKFVLFAKPTAELPQETLTAFAEHMENLIAFMDTPQLHTALENILHFTQENKHLQGILRESDVALFVKAARKSYGLTVTAKTGNKKKKTKKQTEVNELLTELQDLDLSI